jgi:hypothetical protein
LKKVSLKSFGAVGFGIYQILVLGSLCFLVYTNYFLPIEKSKFASEDHTHYYNYAERNHDHDYADEYHDHDFAESSHTHSASDLDYNSYGYASYGSIKAKIEELESEIDDLEYELSEKSDLYHYH